jgi:16S rRNA (guanine(966)-N(2))-methyltransferase RsmD
VRIVGGEARGRVLRAVPGRSTRPTSDRVRQSLFDTLGQRCDDLRVLDLFAGTGALGLEALSRGAREATLIDDDKHACAVAERNAQTLGYGDRCRIVCDDVFRAVPRLSGSYDLIFCDPPYAARATGAVLEALASRMLLAEGGRAVLEKDRREPLPAMPPAFRLSQERRYGDTVLLFVEGTG